MKPNYAIARIKKHKLTAKSHYLINHHLRLVAVQNADQDRLTKNKVLFQVPNPNKFLNEVPEKTRKNAVKFVDMLFTASRFDTLEQQKQWVTLTVGFINSICGAENIALIVLHEDETTPHIHAIFKPIKDGKLNASHWFDGMKKMHAFQDRYFESVKSLGFSRGIKGSRRKHKEVREFYRDIEAGMNAYDEFKKELANLYKESKRPPNIWERLNPNSYFERLRPHFLKLIPMAKQVMAHQEILRADQKEDTIKKLSDKVRDLEHRFEELVGGVPSWPQITRLRDELGRFKEFEGTIKLYEQNKKQFEELTTSASEKNVINKPKL